jgi:polyisoprenoid-binding protein YceI
MSTQTIQRTGVPTGTWKLDPSHSFARFEVRHGGISTFRGGFTEIDASLEGGERPKLEGAVKVASLDVADEQIKGHLLTPDFFDAENHPEVRFTSTSIDVADDGEITVSGTLDIAGHEREVEAHGRLGVADFGVEKLGISLSTGVDRRDYGIDWQMELPSGGIALDYDVTLDVELEFAKEDD